MALDYTEFTIEDSRTAYENGTAPEVRAVLEEARNKRARIRIWYGNTATGEAWLEEHSITGRVGRSTGMVKVPLLISRSTSRGGEAISTGSIIRIDWRLDAKSVIVKYRHPLFHLPTLACAIGTNAGWEYEVQGPGGEVIARFPSEQKRQEWLDFHAGKRWKY